MKGMAKTYGYHVWQSSSHEVRGLSWVFMPRYTVVKPTQPIPTMEKKVNLADRDWRYDSMSRNVVDFNSYPPAVGGKAFGIVNQSSLFASPTFISYQGDGYINQRVRLKDVQSQPVEDGGFEPKWKSVIDIQGLPPMGVLPVGTVLRFPLDICGENESRKLFEEHFGDATFAKKLREWTWVIVDNTNANAMGIVDGKRQWGGNCTYRLLRIKMSSNVDNMDWGRCYTWNKTNMVDLRSDVLHDILRAGIQNQCSPTMVEEVWKRAVESYGERFGYGIDGKIVPIGGGTLNYSVADINTYIEDFLNMWYVFTSDMDVAYGDWEDGAAYIEIEASRNLIGARPPLPNTDDYLSGPMQVAEAILPSKSFYHKHIREYQYRQTQDFASGKPVKSSFLIPFLTLPETQYEVIHQHSCYPSLLSPIIKPNHVHREHTGASEWINDIYFEEQKMSRAWRQGLADFIGLDLWDIDNPHYFNHILEFLDYPVIWYILRWLNGKPSFGGPLWADYQQDVEYIYEWVGENRKPDLTYSRKLSLW